MKNLNIITAALSLALTCCTALAETSVSVNLSISRPTENVTKTGDSKPKHTRRGVSTATETKNSIFEYTGKVGCNVPKEKSVNVTLEAYFVTRLLGRKGAKDEVGSRREIDKFEFGGDNPNLCKFTLTSPTISQTTVTTVKTSRRRGRRGGGSSSTDKEKSGTRLMGVIVRAMVDGKPVKVISEPNNSKWVAAGKKPIVQLD